MSRIAMLLYLMSFPCPCFLGCCVLWFLGVYGFKEWYFKESFMCILVHIFVYSNFYFFSMKLFFSKTTTKTLIWNLGCGSSIDYSTWINLLVFFDILCTWSNYLKQLKKIAPSKEGFFEQSSQTMCVGIWLFNILVGVT